MELRRNVKLTGDMAAAIPEEVASLMDKISDACDDDDGNHILVALWLSLLAALMAANECSPMEAMDHAQDLIKWTKGGCDEAIATLSTPH